MITEMSSDSNYLIKGNPYNGYSALARATKYKVLYKLIREGLVPLAAAPCALCNDPNTPVEYHSEDYGEPFLWVPPAMYCLCRNCHRDKMHKRFWRHDAWHAFIAHVRRGGYAKDLKDPTIKHEVNRYRLAQANGEKFRLKTLRTYPHIIGEEWFANLTLEASSLINPNARLRQDKLVKHPQQIMEF